MLFYSNMGFFWRGDGVFTPNAIDANRALGLHVKSMKSAMTHDSGSHENSEVDLHLENA